MRCTATTLHSPPDPTRTTTSRYHFDRPTALNITCNTERDCRPQALAKMLSEDGVDLHGLDRVDQRNHPSRVGCGILGHSTELFFSSYASQCSDAVIAAPDYSRTAQGTV